MSLRPRYSLLTLLILTALVAGGVKLWHGPHHVIERPTPLKEDEYTYTRDWHGKRIIQGPRILRSKTEQGKIEYVDVRYYRSGLRMDWVYGIVNHQEQKPRLVIPFTWNEEFVNPLTSEERRECLELLEREKPLDLKSELELGVFASPEYSYETELFDRKQR